MRSASCVSLGQDQLLACLVSTSGLEPGVTRIVPTGLSFVLQCEETLNAKKKTLNTMGLKHISQTEAKAIANVAEDSMEM